MRHDGQGGQYREQKTIESNPIHAKQVLCEMECNLRNVIIFTLWDGRLFSLVQAWEYSYSNNTVKEDIPNLNKQENEKLNFFSRVVLLNDEAWWPSGKAFVS